MPKFDVLVERKMRERVVVQIDAETQEEAQEMTESEDFLDVFGDLKWTWIGEETDAIQITEAK